MTHRPPWCGRCDQRTRQLLLRDDRAARCPRCHPLLTAPAASTPAPRPLPSAGGYLTPVDDRAAAQERADADAVVAAFAATGEPFSANDLRPHFDAADVSRPLRGTRVAAALSAGMIVEQGTTRSTDPGTHGKRIGVYRGTARAAAAVAPPTTLPTGRAAVPAPRATPRTVRPGPRCDSCGHPVDAALAASGERRHPTCSTPPRGHAAQRWAAEHRPRDLTLAERLALVVLARYADEQPPSWPGRDTLARQSGLGADKLAAALDGLARRGLVRGLHASCSSCARQLVPALAVDDRQPACPSCGPQLPTTPGTAA